MNGVRRTLNLVSGSFVVAAAILVTVVTSIDLGEPESPDLADGAALATTVFGLIGLLVALLWYSRAGESRPSPARVQMGFIIRVSIAELGLLIGLVALFMTGSTTPAWIGFFLFLASLLMLWLGLRRIPE